MFITEVLAHDRISQAWTPEVRAIYIRFSVQLMRSYPLQIKIGKGGLSYTLNFQGDHIFACHFNAKPRSSRDDLGFADFRYDALRPHLDVDAAIKAITQAAPPEIEVKARKLWCSLQFPLTSANTVADLLREHIIVRIAREQK
jgi:hypothetical protein